MWKWLERVIGRRPGFTPPGVRSRIDFLPTFHAAHESVLIRLHEMHPDLDYYAPPGGRVMLLQHQPGKPRIETGRRTLKKGSRAKRFNPDPLLNLHGWALLADLPYRSLYDGSFLARAHRVINATPDDVKAAEAAALIDQESEAFAAAVRDRLGGEGRSDHAILFRKRKSFSRTA